jgi:hypothetical protein
MRGCDGGMAGPRSQYVYKVPRVEDTVGRDAPGRCSVMMSGAPRTSLFPDPHHHPISDYPATYRPATAAFTHHAAHHGKGISLGVRLGAGTRSKMLLQSLALVQRDMHAMPSGQGVGAHLCRPVFTRARLHCMREALGLRVA